MQSRRQRCRCARRAGRRADLHRRGMGAQQPSILQIETCHASRAPVICRNVQRFEVVELVLGLRTCGDFNSRHRRKICSDAQRVCVIGARPRAPRRAGQREHRSPERQLALGRWRALRSARRLSDRTLAVRSLGRVDQRRRSAGRSAPAVCRATQLLVQRALLAEPRGRARSPSSGNVPASSRQLALGASMSRLPAAAKAPGGLHPITNARHACASSRSSAGVSGYESPAGSGDRGASSQLRQR